jgi:ribosome-associated protein
VAAQSGLREQLPPARVYRAKQFPGGWGGGAVVSGDLIIRSGVVVPHRELSWRFSRSSGPGGQGVNTTDSRVELSLDVAHTDALNEVLRARATARLAGRLVDGVLTVTASQHRSQLRNREAAQARLAQLLSEAIARPGGTPTDPAQPRVAVAPARGQSQARRGQTSAPRPGHRLTNSRSGCGMEQLQPR